MSDCKQGVYNYTGRYKKSDSLDCKHNWDKKQTKTNQIGRWETCKKCKTTKLFIK